MSNGRETHLQLIQSVISRMAGNSFLLRGWSVTVIAAVFALAAKESDRRLAYIALLPCIAFWALDGYYLWQERLFRDLYNDVRGHLADSANFSMDTSTFKATQKLCSALCCGTVVAFHGPLLVVVVLAIGLLNFWHR